MSKKLIECSEVSFKDNFLPSISIYRENLGKSSFSNVKIALNFFENEVSFKDEQNSNEHKILGRYYYTHQAILQINAIIRVLRAFKNL